MGSRTVCLVFWCSIFSWCNAAEPQSATSIAEAGIRQFYTDVVSTDDKVSRDAIKAFVIDESGLQTLFGKDDGTKLWTMLSRLFENPGVLQSMRQEIANKGAIKKIELIDVRKDDASGRFKEILTKIPKDIPVFRALITTEKGESGSSAYVVINNQVRFIKGLESLAEVLKRQGM